MIIFKRIKYKNLLSTGNDFTTVDLNKNGMTLIVGENAVGKSTYIDGLTFGLFGKAYRNINKPQLVNSINQKELIVEVEFSIGSLDYKVVRGIKPDIFQIFRNEQLIPQSDRSKDYQDTLEKQILKINYKTFCQIVVLGNANFKPFMQLDKAERRAIIENLLDLQIFTNMNTLLKEKIIQNNDKLIECNQEKRLLEEKIKLIQEHITELQNNNTALIEEKKDQIVLAEEMMHAFIFECDQLEKIIKELKDTVSNEDVLKDKIQTLSSIKHKIEARLSTLNKEVKFFNEHDDCPTCKQPINKDFKDETVKSKSDQIDKINSNMEILIEQYETTNSKIQDIMNIHSKINENNIELHKTRSKVHYHENQKESLELEIKSIQKKMKSSDNSKIDEIEKSLDLQKKNYNDIVEQKQIMTILTNLLKDGGIKSRIIKQYIPVMNKFINSYLSQMEFMCQFDLDEEFKETIKSRYRDEFSYGSFSEGQKSKIDLALLFTWRAIAKLRNSVSTNLLIFDEILDSSLSTTSLEYFMEIIKIMSSKENIFIISHREQFSDKFENIIRFELVKNFSQIVSE